MGGCAKYGLGEDFKMITDDVFGQIQFKTMWCKKDRYTMYGKEFEIDMLIQGEEYQAPSESQKAAYSEFCKKKDDLQKEMERKIFDYYQTVCEEYREMFEDDADLYAPQIESTEQLKGYVKPQAIMIPKQKENRVINVLFKTKWDLEMGIGIQLVDENISIVGVQADIL